MRILVRTAILFLLLSLAVSWLTTYWEIEFGRQSYWDTRGVFFLVFVSLFPRLTLLFSSVASGGILWWLGWVFAPRILVAMLATVSYWHKNPILVLLAWLAAWGGETGEKTLIVHRTRRAQRGFQDAKWVAAEAVKGPKS
jgi:hypothetical protein